MRDPADARHAAQVSLPVRTQLSGCGDDRGATGIELIADQSGRDVCLAEAHAVGQQRTATALDDVVQPVECMRLERLETGGIRCGPAKAGVEHAQRDRARIFNPH